MRNFLTKINNDPSQAAGVLTAEEFNDYITNLEDLVSSSGQSLIDNDGTQLSKAMANYSTAAQYFQDSGAVNTYTLSVIGTFRPPSQLLDGMRIRFFAANTNSGASTVNLAGIGATAVRRPNGDPLSAGDIQAGAEIELTYRSSLTYFILSQNVKQSGNQTIFDTKTFASVPGTSADPSVGNDLVRLSYLQSYVAANTTSAVPAGHILPWPGNAAPAGYSFAYGQAVSRTTYAAAFAVYSTVYGSGDGSTTFNLPDLRGRTIFGRDDMGGSPANRITTNGIVLGSTGGEDKHLLTVLEMPSHTHTYTAWSASGSGASNGSGNGGISSNTGAQGGGTSHNNMPPYTVMNWIVKL